jgi:vesicular inhibitory amino acid transporter
MPHPLIFCANIGSRSSIALRLNALAQVGGVNSIENFAKSWQRAATFIEVTPHRPSFILSADQERDEEEAFHYGRTEYGRAPRTSLLRAHLEASGAEENAIEDESDAPDMDPSTSHTVHHKESESSHRASDLPGGSVRGSHSIFAIAPHLATPLAGSYGTSYGTLQSTLSESSMIHAGNLWRQQQADAARIAEGEREPLFVKEVEQDGKLILVVEGQSTLPQTIFNSTNVLIGVGLLSLPLGIKYAGWICGMIFLLFSALVTAYTANLLAKCMDVDASLITFADLAFISFGQKARIATSILFMLELLAACVALGKTNLLSFCLRAPRLGVSREPACVFGGWHLSSRAISCKLRNIYANYASRSFR